MTEPQEPDPSSPPPGWHPPGSEPGGEPTPAPGASAPGWAAVPPPPAPPGFGAAPGGWGPPPPGWGGAPPAAKPGVIPLRPLGVLEILDGAITTMRQHWRVMIGLSFAVAAATGAISLVFSVASLGALRQVENLDPATAQIGDVVGAFSGALVAALVAAFLQYIGLVVLVGMLTVIVGQAVLGRPVDARAAWAGVRPVILPLLGLSLLVGLAVSIGLVLCFVPGFVLAVYWSLSSPALVLEKATVLTAMSRSWRLVAGSFWRTVGVLALLLVLYLVTTTAVSIPFSVPAMLVPIENPDGSLNGTWFMVNQLLATVGSIVAATIAYPFVASAITLLYLDQRMRREALDLTLQRAAGVAPGPPAGPPAGPPTGPPTGPPAPFGP